MADTTDLGALAQQLVAALNDGSTSGATVPAAHRVLPSREARWAESLDGVLNRLTAPVRAAVEDGLLPALGGRLYSHQVQALEAGLDGRDVIVATGPASGKSLCFLLPVVDRLVRDPTATAMVVYPRKALIWDQMENLSFFEAGLEELGESPVERVAASTKKWRTQRHADPIIRKYGDRSFSIEPGLFERTLRFGDGSPGLTVAVITGDNRHMASNVEGGYEDQRSGRRYLLHDAGGAGARLVLTTHDVLHAQLPLFRHSGFNEDQLWTSFLERLSVLVIDEVHYHRGAAAAHLTNLLRRLQRIRHHLRTEAGQPETRLQFLASSATVADPRKTLARLVDREVDDDQLVCVGPEEDGGPLPARHLITAPLGDGDSKRALGTVLEHLARVGGKRVLAFFNSRDPLNQTREFLCEQSGSPDFGEWFANSHGVVSSELQADETNRIVGLFKASRTTVLFSTSALEMGLDLGDLQVVVLVGHPGSAASFRQRAGRVVGRRKEVLVVALLFPNPLEHAFAEHPESLFDPGQLEPMQFDPQNRDILRQHLVVSALELPLSPEDGRWFHLEDDPDLERLVREASDADSELELRDGAVTFTGTKRRSLLARRFELGTWGGYVDLRCDGTVLSTENLASATPTLFPGALVQRSGGRKRLQWFEVMSWQLTTGRGGQPLPAAIELRALDRAPEVRRYPEVDHGFEVLPQAEQPSPWPAIRVAVGPCSLVTRVRGYFETGPGESQDEPPRHPLPQEIPGFTLQTRGVTLAFNVDDLALSEDLLCSHGKGDEARAAAVCAGLRAIGAALRETLPLFVECDPSDVGADIHQGGGDGQGTVVLYDLVDGGYGFAESLATRWPRALKEIRERLADCQGVSRARHCNKGCTVCLGQQAMRSDRLSGDGRPVYDRRVAVAILEAAMEVQAPQPYFAAPVLWREALSGAALSWHWFAPELATGSEDVDATLSNVDLLTTGGYGHVFRAMAVRRDGGKPVAVTVKVPDLTGMTGVDHSTVFAEEAQHWERVGHHDNVDRFLCICQARNPKLSMLPCLVTTYVAGDTLSRAMDHLQGVERVAIMEGIATGLAHLHAHEVVHFDLKPANILLRCRDGELPVPRITDFGTARALDAARGKTVATPVGYTVGYAAPEQRPQQGQVALADYPADIYAFGVMIFEFVTGRLPDHDDAGNLATGQQEALQAAVGERGMDMSAAGLSSLVASMVTADPKRRPAIAAVRDSLATCRKRRD